MADEMKPPKSGSGESPKSRLADGVRSNPQSQPKTPPPKQSETPSSNPTNAPSSGKGDTGDTANQQQQPTQGDASQKGTNKDNKNDASSKDPSSKSGGLGDLAKNQSANATGVDYSDKGLKDQLEHQAADAAMDATPVLGQANSARKALKKYNKAKKDMGGEEGLTDDVEKVADDAVDKGIKGAKMLAGAKLGADVGLGALMMGLMFNAVMALKGMAAAVLAKVAGFFVGIFNGIAGFASSVLGVAAGVANTIAAGFTATVVLTGAVVSYLFVGGFENKDDSMAGCVPWNTKVDKKSQEYIFGEGGIAVTHEDHAIKIYSVLEALGGSKEQVAALLGNLHLESSGLDPTATETVYNEPFMVGARKQNIESKDFQIRLIDPAYSKRFPAITYLGIGIAQWTNGRNRLLVKYAEANDSVWYDFDTQVRFMIEGDDEMRKKQLTAFITSTPTTVDKETLRFMTTWIGLPKTNASLKGRQVYAKDYMFVLERAEADTEYADSILSGINVNRSEGNRAAGAYHKDDGCGKPIKYHYGNDAIDGTGEVPPGLALVPWSRLTLPESLREYAKDPEAAGLAWGNASGWASGIIPDQCVAFATSYFMRLYPSWNQGGKKTTRPFGNGKDTAPGWAKHYKQKISNAPAAGSVFSDKTASSWGHTGIVQHVFANGDILIAEQNVRGISGEGAGLNYSWGWRIIKKDKYVQARWEFFKPADEEPQWGQGSMM